MKQKDIALIIIISFVSGVVSFVTSNFLFVSQSNRQQSVVVVDAISTTFMMPDTKFFNAESVNPAKSIQVGTSNNTNPFNGTGH
jgi:hypothetical protein